MFEKLWLAAVITLLANLAYVAQATPLSGDLPSAEPTYLLTQKPTLRAQ